jgi:predicted SAM-dependent methyltransferase
MKNYTRGDQPLEKFLAEKRAQKANSLIPLDLRKGKKNNLYLKKDSVESKKLPFKDNFFSVVTMLAVFEHIDQKNLSGLLKEIKRVLKKDGIFIITTPAPWSDKLLHNMAKIGLISPEEIHEHKHNKKRGTIENIIVNAGFERKDIKSGFFEFGLNMWFSSVK